MQTKNKEPRETITVTVQYEVKIDATGATHDERKQRAESLAGTRLTKYIGCKLISVKSKE
jgi:hypothetical protein